ncbi:MAG: hypothetical protein PVI46_09210, partial [Lysobacterales bacterium]
QQSQDQKGEQGNQDEQSEQQDSEQNPDQQGEEGRKDSENMDYSEAWSEEDAQAMEQWLRRIPDDPGGLLRRKFRSQHQRRGAPNDESQGW